jgi:hypothetical protein
VSITIDVYDSEANEDVPAVVRRGRLRHVHADTASVPAGKFKIQLSKRQRVLLKGFRVLPEQRNARLLNQNRKTERTEVENERCAEIAGSIYDSGQNSI